MSLKRALAGLILALLAVAGHVFWWYLPRERKVAVDPDSPAGRLFLDAREPLRLWVAFPHQNLGRLSRGEDGDAWLGALSRQFGADLESLPRFGPLRLPPARSLAVAVDPESSHGRLSMEVYPLIGTLARLAGRLASNPLLSGGGVELGGRSYDVSWQRGSWTVVTEGLPALAEGSAVSPAPAIAWLSLATPVEPLPAGDWRLDRRDGDLVLTLEGAAPAEKLPGLLAELGSTGEQVVFLARGASVSGTRSWMLLLRGPEDVGLPAMAVAADSERDRWRLPGEKVVRFLDLDVRLGRVGPWRTVAYGERAADGIGRLATHLSSSDGVSDDFIEAMWVEPSGLLPLVVRIRTVLAAIPLIDRREVQKWRDYEALLRPLGPLEAVSLEVSSDAAGKVRGELRFRR